MQSCARICLTRHLPCIRQVVRPRFFAVAASAQQEQSTWPVDKEGSDHGVTALQTSPRTALQAASPSDGKQPSSVGFSPLSVATERIRVQRVIQKRISRLPPAQQRLRRRNPSTDHESRHSQRKQTKRPRKGCKSVQEISQEWDTFIHRLGDLSRIRPSRDSHGKEIELTAAFAKHYTGTNRHNSWIEYVGSGARVDVVPCSLSKPTRQVLLYGSERAVELASLGLTKLQTEFESSDAGKPAPDGGTGRRMVDIDNINSISSFYNFVLQMTFRFVPVSLVPKASPLDGVLQALINVFKHPIASRYASTASLNLALRFLARQPNIMAADAARKLYETAADLHLSPGLSTFNILLGTAIRRGDVERASFYLAEMYWRSVSPNATTWTFLFSLKHLNDKAPILRLMMENGVFLRGKGLRILVRAAVSDLLPSPRPSVEELRTVIAHLNSIFGPGWLDPETYRYFVVRFSRWPREGVTALLKELRWRHDLKLRPNSIHYLELMNRKGPINSSQMAAFVACLGSVPLERQSHLIAQFFLTAWQRCFYNVCSVLWCFAATRGLISREMKRPVMRHLVLGNLHNLASSSRTFSRKCLGARVVVGVHWRRSKEAVALMCDMFPKLATHFADRDDVKSKNGALRWLTGYTPDDGTRDEQMSFFFLTLHDDFEAWKRFRAMSFQSLTRLLGWAYDKDQHWIRTGQLDSALRDPEATVQLLDQALHIPMAKLEPGEENIVVKAKLEQHARVMKAAGAFRHGLHAF